MSIGMKSAIRQALRTLAGVAASAAFATTALAGTLSLTGLVSNSGSTYSIAQLQALGSFSETVNGDTYVGVSLWSLLGGTAGGASNITTTGGGNNPILRNYLVASGADGSKSLISAGEIDPLFGGTGLPYLVAYQKNGVTLATPSLIVPQDGSGTRAITDLTSLQVQGAPIPTQGPRGVQSTQFTLTGVANPGTYNLAALQALPAASANNVTFFSGTTPNGPFNFTGVGVWNLLTSAGIAGLDQSTGYVLATGTDGFQVLYSIAELNPALGLAPRLVAYAVDGNGLAGAGFARMVIPGDLRGGRYVSNLASLEVVAAPVPEPAPALMFAAGVLVLIARARKRNEASSQA